MKQHELAVTGMVMPITRILNFNLGIVALLMFAVVSSTANGQADKTPTAAMANVIVTASDATSVVATSGSLVEPKHNDKLSASPPATPAMASASDPKTLLKSSTKTPASTSTAAQLLQVLMGLGAVLLLIFALSWVLKRVGNSTGFTASQIKVVSSMNMGSREKIVLTEVNGQQLLLGVTATSINMLHHFDTEDKSTAQAAVKTTVEPKAESVVDFKSKLANVMAANKKPV